MTDMPPVATTVHVTEPSVCCQTCDSWLDYHEDSEGECRYLSDRQGSAVLTPATFACTEWAAR